MRRLAGGRAQSQGRLDPRPGVGDLVAEPVERHRRGGHRVADHHAADRHQVAGRRVEDAERDDQAERARAGDGQRDQQRPEGARDLLGATARGQRAEQDHHREQRQDEPDRVGLEDQLDHVADRGELDEGADRRHRDVLLQVRLAPEGDRGGDRDQDEGRGDLPSVTWIVGDHVSTLLQRARVDRRAPPPAAPPSRLSRRACSGSWLTTTKEMSQLAAQLRQGRLDRVAGGVVEGRGRLVEQQHVGLLGQGAGQHRPLLLADRELGDVALGELGVEAGEPQAPLRVERAAREVGGEAQVRLDGPLEQRRQLRDQRDLAAQLQRVVLGERGGRGRRSSRRRGRRAG